MTGLRRKTRDGARAISNRGGVKVISFFPSLRTGQMIPCEGMLELDFMRIVDRWPNVTDIQAQPVEVIYSYDSTSGRVWLGHDPAHADSAISNRHCYPDFLIKFHDRKPLLVEVKLKKYLDTPEVRRKMAVCHDFAQSQGWDFQTFSEDAIRTPHLQAATITRRYERMQVPEDVKMATLACLSSIQGPISCRVLAGRLVHAYPTALAYVYALLTQRALTCVGNELVLSPETLVSPLRMGGRSY